MNVRRMMVFASYCFDDCSDARVWDEEIRLARLAADLGVDCLWSAEHHFNDCSTSARKAAAAVPRRPPPPETKSSGPDRASSVPTMAFQT
jgi:alkanesulfonate monooxygenase SsuD/methylene tetrahydromethanopterin reductase-like flavin-dependent oxidoreductase (luciferase family)